MEPIFNARDHGCGTWLVSVVGKPNSMRPIEADDAAKAIAAYKEKHPELAAPAKAEPAVATPVTE